MLFFLLLFGSTVAVANPKDKSPEDILTELAIEIKAINTVFYVLFDNAINHLQQLNNELLFAKTIEEKVTLLLQKDKINTELQALQRKNENDISKVRYLKGLQIIKILYEKVLSLDHHFASVRTLSEINKMSNPTQYPEYIKLRELISSKKDKKTGFDLTSVLGTNTIVSVVQTFTKMMG